MSFSQMRGRRKVVSHWFTIYDREREREKKQEIVSCESNFIPVITMLEMHCADTEDD